jgi:hypothetical protein
VLACSAPSGTACRRLIPASILPLRQPLPGPPAREALHEEFRGSYSLEAIERFVDESIDRMSGARVVDFIPLFMHRFARAAARPGSSGRSHHE